MKRIFLLLMIVAAVAAPAFGQANGDEKAVRQYFDEMNAAMLKDDFAAMGRMYADDFVYVGTNGELQNKAERLASAKGSSWSFASLKRDLASVRVMGDTAVVVSHLTFTGKDRKDGQTFNGANRTTTTLAKRDGRWQAIASQTTRELPPVEESTLNQFLDGYLAALPKNSAEVVGPFLGSQYVRVGPDGSSINKEQMLTALRSGDLKYTSVAADERTWRMFGREFAISTARVTLKASLKGQDMGGTYRATTVLRKNAVDRWVLVSTHLSRLEGK